MLVGTGLTFCSDSYAWLNSEARSRRSCSSIRTRDWRLIVYEDGAQELYDHRNDQDEFHNLAADPAHQETIEQLSQWLPQNATPEFRKVSERAKARAN